MPNHLKLCGCRICRGGMRTRMKKHVRNVVRRFRQQAKRLLKQGKQPEPKISAGYTD